jgi:hypothetical protein
MMTREEAIKHFEAWAQCNYAPTRDAALMALSALRPVSREQVEKVQGEWIPVCDTVQDVLREFPQYEMLRGYKCSLCGRFEEKEQPFCNCGAPMTDEAVQMVMERLEELNNA